MRFGHRVLIRLVRHLVWIILLELVTSKHFYGTMVQRFQIHILPYLVCDFKMAFNPIVCSIFHNSAIKIPNVVKQVQVVQTIFFTLMIIIRHQILTWNWTITTYTNDFFELNLHFCVCCIFAEMHVQKLSCARTIKMFLYGEKE